MTELSAEALVALPPACRDARKSLQDKRSEARQFFYLVFGASVLLLALLAYAGINALNTKAVQAILGTAAAIADGSALAFIVGRWQETNNNVKYWQRVVNRECAKEPDAVADIAA